MLLSVPAELTIKWSGVMASSIVDAAYFMAGKIVHTNINIILALFACFSVGPVLSFLVFVRLASLLVAVLAVVLAPLGFLNGLTFRLLAASHFYTRNLSRLRTHCVLSTPKLGIVSILPVWILMMALSVVDGLNAFVYKKIKSMYSTKCVDCQEARIVFFLLASLLSSFTVLHFPTFCVDAFFSEYADLYSQYYMLVFVPTVLVFVYAVALIRYLIETTDDVGIHNKSKDKKYIYEWVLMGFDLHGVLVETFASMFTSIAALVSAACVYAARLVAGAAMSAMQTCQRIYRTAREKLSGASSPPQ